MTVEDAVEEVGRAGQVLRAVGEGDGQVGRELVRRQRGPLLDEAATGVLALDEALRTARPASHQPSGPGPVTAVPR